MGDATKEASAHAVTVCWFCERREKQAAGAPPSSHITVHAAVAPGRIYLCSGPSFLSATCERQRNYISAPTRHSTRFSAPQIKSNAGLRSRWKGELENKSTHIHQDVGYSGLQAKPEHPQPRPLQHHRYRATVLPKPTKMAMATRRRPCVGMGPLHHGNPGDLWSSQLPRYPTRPAPPLC